MQVKIGKLEEEMKNIRKALEDNQISPEKANEKMGELDQPKWDQWIQFRKAMNNLDTDANQYILISDRLLDQNDLNDYSVLGRIQWRAVLDLDPASEDGGLLAAFKECKGRGALNLQQTPASIKSHLMRLKNMEPHQTQWVFVNGRYNDEANEPKTTADDWNVNYGGAISRFIDFCVTKFDHRKPTVCLILPLGQTAREITTEVLKMLTMYLHPSCSRYSFVCLNEDLQLPAFKTMRCFKLSPRYLRIGILTLLGTPEGQYRLPSAQSGCPVPLNERQYLSLQGYLEPLFFGCQRLPNGLSKEEIERLKSREEDKFVSGNPISFLSLHFNHDAKREISRKIGDHLRNELSTLYYTKVEEICHSPGTGGTTIARRLLWDLHQVYPCAIANVSQVNTVTVLESEADSFLTDLADRINFLYELCEKPPVILIDGKSFLVDALTAQLERKLTTMRTKAILLCCIRPRKDTKDRDCSHVVNSNLEDSLADLHEFQQKYRRYEGVDWSEATRVFHFPLLALMKDFHPKLRDIVSDSLEILKTAGYEYEVVITVAFILIYAEQPTPALLLYEMFKEHFLTSPNYNRGHSARIVQSYADIKSLFSGNLLNLMINKKSTNNRRWVQQEEEFEGYTVQHPQVAHFVLEHAERPLHSIVQDFLNKPIFSREEFRFLLSDLFIYNKGRSPNFSFLMNQLTKGASSHVAGKIFCDVAEKTNDANFFSNAARFYVYVISPPDFKKAEQLIDRALNVDSISDSRRKRVYDTLGTIRKVSLHNRLTAKQQQFKTADDVAIPAQEAIEAFRRAKYEGFPNPLVGELEVWLDCLDWIIEHICDYNTRRAIDFITFEGPTLFRFAIRTCYDLLHELEEIIINTEKLSDPKRTQELASICRERLFSMFGTTPSQTGRAGMQDLNLLAELKSLTSVGKSKEHANEFKKIAVLQRLRKNRKLELLPRKVRSSLIELLKEIVIADKEYKYTLDLLRVGSLPSEKSLSLDDALQLAQSWATQPQHSAYPWLFIYMICFVKILGGKAIADFRPVYEKALNTSRDRSEGNCSRHAAQYYFIGQGAENSMTQLVTKSQLDALYHKRNRTDTETSSEVQINDEFLKNHGRNFLRICEGRIFVNKVRRGHTVMKDPYIMTLSGNLKIYTPRTAIRVYRDFEEGDRVSFVVSFSMVGPRAHGIETGKIKS